MLKTLGGVLLVVGVTIGAGTLALPLVTAAGGFFPGVFVLCCAWLLTYLGALYTLEVNLWLPENSNLMSMTKMTLGKPFQMLAWLAYLVLLYSILCAYLAGSADMTSSLLGKIDFSISHSTALFLFLALLGSVVYFGIYSVDWLNRLLMTIKLGALLLLFLFVMPHVEAAKLQDGSPPKILLATMTIITSMSYAVIVPSLRAYFQSDVKAIKRILFFGSLIPLVCYILWNLIVIGVVPSEGANGLIAIAHSDRSTSLLSDSLSAISRSGFIPELSHLFVSICMVTSFLGISLCLFDFFTDAFGLKRSGWGRVLCAFLVYFPPTAIVLFHPGIFIRALDYAGTCCVILMIFLPALMIAKGRYIKHCKGSYQVCGGKYLVGIEFFFGVCLLLIAVAELFNYLPRWV